MDVDIVECYRKLNSRQKNRKRFEISEHTGTFQFQQRRNNLAICTSTCLLEQLGSDMQKCREPQCELGCQEQTICEITLNKLPGYPGRVVRIPTPGTRVCVGIATKVGRLI